jgi:hypothetical protein
MRKCVFGVILLLSVVVQSSPAFGQLYWLMASPLGEPETPIVYDTGGIVTVGIYATGFWALNTVHFALHIRECEGLTLTSVSYGSNLYLGDLESGVAVTFIGCKYLPYLVCTLTFQSTGIDECCYLDFLPANGSGGVEGVDCNSDIVAVSGLRGVIAPAGSGALCAAPTPPANPSPPDGAVDVSIMPALSWESELPLPAGACDALLYNVYLGKTQTPPLRVFGTVPPWTAGPLEPNTTYYWWIRASMGCASTDGPLWSFTTGAPVGIEASTWGRIKALYQ